MQTKNSKRKCTLSLFSYDLKVVPYIVLCVLSFKSTQRNVPFWPRSSMQLHMLGVTMGDLSVHVHDQPFLYCRYVYTAPSDMLDSQPGTLMLTDCIDTCARNSSCKSINYETGLCVLFSSSADDSEGKLKRKLILLLSLKQEWCMKLEIPPPKSNAMVNVKWKFYDLNFVWSYQLKSDLTRKFFCNNRRGLFCSCS